MSANTDIKDSQLFSLHCEHGLADLVATMYASIWETRGYDMELRNALTASLVAVSACGVVGHVSGRGQLVHINPVRSEPTKDLEGPTLKALHRILAFQRKLKYNQPIRFPINGTYSGIVVIFPKSFTLQKKEGYLAQDEDFHYCCLIYARADIDGKGKITSDDEDRFTNFHANSTLPLFHDAFRHRERRFAPFPVKISERYWKDSLADTKLSNAKFDERLRPPWETNATLHGTATLCLDLRKSTFCMEHSDKPEQFGRWMDSLVSVITRVCHNHGGVFDKFTGDGGLMHFLERESNVMYGKSALEFAIHCARAMQSEIKTLIEELRNFIRFDSRLLGAGIAIDVGEAFWSLDYRDNPIVVGRVVVGACRICDSAKGGKVRITNIACKRLPQQMLSELLLCGLNQVALSTKELDKDMEILVWEF